MNSIMKAVGSVAAVILILWFALQFYIKYRVDEELAKVPASVATISYKKVTAYPWGKLRFGDLTVTVGPHTLTAAETTLPLIFFDIWPKHLHAELNGIVWRDSYESGQIAAIAADFQVSADEAPTVTGALTIDGISMPAEAWGLGEDETRLLNWAAGWTGIPGRGAATVVFAPSETTLQATTELTGLFRSEQTLIASGWQEMVNAGVTTSNLLALANFPDRLYLIEWVSRWQDLGIQQRLVALRSEKPEVAEILTRDARRIERAARMMARQPIDSAPALADAVAKMAEPYVSHELRLRPLAPVPLTQPLRALALWQQGQPELLANQAALFGLEIKTELPAPVVVVEGGTASSGASR